MESEESGSFQAELADIKVRLERAGYEDGAVLRLLMDAGFPFVAPVVTSKEVDDRLQRLEDELRHVLGATHECRCRLGQSELHAVRFLIAESSDRERARGFLRDQLVGATQVTVCDPYLFKGDIAEVGKTGADYCEDLARMMPDSAEVVEVFFNDGEKFIKKKIRDRFVEVLTSEGVDVEQYPTNRIHDRVWIKDNASGWVVGTSFNGLGKKLAFLLPLPKSDLKEFLGQLRQIRETRQQSQQPNTAKPKDTGG